MQKFTRLLLAFTLAAAMMLPCLPVFATNNNPATDWMVGAYGIDGPSPAVNIPPIVPEEFDERMHAFDVKGAVDIAEKAGADYMLIGATQVDGYLIAPNPVYDEITGHKPGEKCSTRDLIEEYYQELSKRGMKLMLYWTGDGPGRDPEDHAKMGWDGTAGETFRKNWFSVAEYWSKKYGDKIAGWWVDGGYSWIGYDHAEVLQEFEAALKAGNPNAVVCFNEGQGEASWDPRWGVNDFTAGENYGLLDAPTDRWLNGVQYHRYMPLYEYNGAGCAYAVPQLIDYMEKVKEAGGCVTLAVGSSGERVMPFDPIQLEVLEALNKALTEGVYPPMSFDGSQKIQAGMCTEMMQLGTMASPRLSIMPIICTTGPKGGGIHWQVSGEKPFISAETMTNGQEMALWSKYSDVTIPENAKNLAISVKAPEENRFAYDHRQEIRLGDMTTEAIAKIPNVGYVDSFWFTSEPVNEQASEGFEIVNVPIDVAAGVQDVYLVNVLKDGIKGYKAEEKIKAINLTEVVQGELSMLTTSTDGSNTLGNLDNNDTFVYRNFDFGENGVQEFTTRIGVDTPWAGQKIEMYIDAPDTTNGKLIATHTVQDTGGWEIFTIQKSPVQKVTGVHDLYMVCRGTEGIGNFDWFQFSDGVSIPGYSMEARMLYELGVYNGISDLTFDPDLGTALDRQTGAVMLLRIFGKEQEALAMTDAECDEILAGFKDKDEIALWAKPHAAYAVKNGIIEGVEKDVFGPTQPLLGKAYCTLILRNLGYTVSADDYNKAAYMLVEKGGLTEPEAKLFNDRELLKNEMVGISYYSMFATATDGTTPMAVLTGVGLPVVELEDVDPSEAVTEIIEGISFDSKCDHALDIPKKYEDNGGYVGNLDGNTWVCYEDVDFGSEGATQFAAKVGCDNSYAGQHIQVRLDSPDAAAVADLEIKGTNGWTTFTTQTTEMEKTTGVHDVYIYGIGNTGICSLHALRFLK